MWHIMDEQHRRRRLAIPFSRHFFSRPPVTRKTKFTMTAASSATAKILGPNLSSNPPCPRCRMLFARQWNVTKAYIIAAIATKVNSPALMRPTLSPKLRSPTASPPRMTVKLSHDKKVRSLAKNTLGSTRVGRAMRLPSHTVKSSTRYRP